MSPSPYDVRAALLAKHAQHVVLVHFPIALFTAAVAYLNLLVAAVSTVPVLGTGLAAWWWALEGQKLRRILLMHFVLGSVSSVLIWQISGFTGVCGAIRGDPCPTIVCQSKRSR